MERRKYENQRRKKKKKKPTPHEWRPPSPEEFGKSVIHGKPYTWNNNGFWKIVSTDDLGLTPGDAAAAAAIAITAAAITTTKQITVGAALTAASIAAKTTKFPTIIGEDAGIDNNGITVTVII